LEEVAGRYLMYRELTVLDRAGEPIAHTQATGTTAWYKRMAADMASKSGIALETDVAEPVVVVWQAVSTQAGERLGTLIAVGGLDQIWRRLRAEAQPEGGGFLVVDETGVPLLDSARPGGDRPRPIDSEGVRRALTGERGVAEYLDESGLAVVGSFRYSTRHRLGLVIELPAEEAFAAVTRMRNVVLLISLLATLFVAGIGSLLALNLTRPIRALSEGAQLVARGDLSAEVPVTSRDQIGDLTRTFNRMVRTLRESREKLENLSMTDELTGLYNRRYLGRILDKELSRARRSGQPLSLLMLDLDHFKAFNDLLGHLEGDALLRQAAQLLTDRFRATDVVSRYGGEEFVAILPATAKVEAAEIAERVRAEFEAHPPFTKLAPRVTLSAGLATYPEDGETQEELLLNADVALYRAKDLGRNRVEMSSLPLKPEDCL
ncbi:MAG: diguanylate cyclase, partial [Acidobacteria bacterium]|nr:diguanylate cyclase [Acidobacteriota bacterium]